MALGTHGDSDGASISPGPSLAPGRARVPGWTKGSPSFQHMRLHVSCIFTPLKPQLPESRRKRVTSTTGLEEHLETPPRKGKQVQIWLWLLMSQFGMAEPRDANPKPSLESAERACLTLQAQLAPMLSPRAPRSQQRRPPAPCTSTCLLLGLHAHGHHPSPCWRTMLGAYQPKRCLQSQGSCSPDQPGGMDF